MENVSTLLGCGCDEDCDYLHAAEGGKFRVTWCELEAGLPEDDSFPWEVDFARGPRDNPSYTEWVHCFATAAQAWAFVAYLIAGVRGGEPVWDRYADDLADQLGIPRWADA